MSEGGDVADQLRAVLQRRFRAPSCFGTVRSITMSSEMASLAFAGLGELEHDDLVAHLGLDLRDVVRDQREHAEETRHRKREQQHRTSLSRIHPPPCRLKS